MAANLADYLKLATVIACGGSWLNPANLIAAGAFDSIRNLVAEAAALVESLRA